MLNVVMLSVIMLNVVMLSVILLSVVVPFTFDAPNSTELTFQNDYNESIKLNHSLDVTTCP